MHRSKIVALVALALASAVGAANRASAQVAQAETPARQSWTFAGPFGYYDPEQLQRGFKIYRQVCSNCHALSIPFRTLTDPNGPDFSAAQVKALAATYKIKAGPNEQGDMYTRPGRPADLFPPPFPNVEAAKAAFGAAPPDMSLVAKQLSYERGFPLTFLDPFIQYQEEGPDMIYAILHGYTNPKDPHYNIYFPGRHIAMPKPLSAGQVKYTDGAPETLDQYSKDIASFLMWAAEPNLDQRKQMGFRVISFLVILAALLYFTKKRIWAQAHSEEEPATHS